MGSLGDMENNKQRFADKQTQSRLKTGCVRRTVSGLTITDRPFNPKEGFMNKKSGRGILIEISLG